MRSHAITFGRLTNRIAIYCFWSSMPNQFANRRGSVITRYCCSARGGHRHSMLNKVPTTSGVMRKSAAISLNTSRMYCIIMWRMASSLRAGLPSGTSQRPWKKIQARSMMLMVGKKHLTLRYFAQNIRCVSGQINAWCS